MSGLRSRTGRCQLGNAAESGLCGWLPLGMESISTMSANTDIKLLSLHIARDTHSASDIEILREPRFVVLSPALIQRKTHFQGPYFSSLCGLETTAGFPNASFSWFAVVFASLSPRTT